MSTFVQQQVGFSIVDGRRPCICMQDSCQLSSSYWLITFSQKIRFGRFCRIRTTLDACSYSMVKLLELHKHADVDYKCGVLKSLVCIGALEPLQLVDSWIPHYYIHNSTSSYVGINIDWKYTVQSRPVGRLGWIVCITCVLNKQNTLHIFMGGK